MRLNYLVLFSFPFWEGNQNMVGILFAFSITKYSNVVTLSHSCVAQPCMYMWHRVALAVRARMPLVLYQLLELLINTECCTLHS